MFETVAFLALVLGAAAVSVVGGVISAPPVCGWAPAQRGSA